MPQKYLEMMKGIIWGKPPWLAPLPTAYAQIIFFIILLLFN